MRWMLKPIVICLLCVFITGCASLSEGAKNVVEPMADAVTSAGVAVGNGLSSMDMLGVKTVFDDNKELSKHVAALQEQLREITQSNNAGLIRIKHQDLVLRVWNRGTENSTVRVWISKPNPKGVTVDDRVIECTGSIDQKVGLGQQLGKESYQEIYYEITPENGVQTNVELHLMLMKGLAGEVLKRIQVQTTTPTTANIPLWLDYGD